jgi:hypothetical protein
MTHRFDAYIDSMPTWCSHPAPGGGEGPLGQSGEGFAQRRWVDDLKATSWRAIEAASPVHDQDPTVSWQRSGPSATSVPSPM